MPKSAATIPTRTHTYQSHLLWEGSTGGGYSGYQRDPPGAHAAVHVRAAGQRRPGLPRRPGAAPTPSSCCWPPRAPVSCCPSWPSPLRRGVDVRSYEDDAQALMPQDGQAMRITQVLLRPHITVAAATDLEAVTRLVERAHEQCYVARSLTAEVLVEPSVEQVAA